MKTNPPKDPVEAHRNLLRKVRCLQSALQIKREGSFWSVGEEMTCFVNTHSIDELTEMLMHTQDCLLEAQHARIQFCLRLMGRAPTTPLAPADADPVLLLAQKKACTISICLGGTMRKS